MTINIMFSITKGFIISTVYLFICIYFTFKLMGIQTTELRITGYLWNGGRVGDGCHDFTDEVHGDVPHHPGSLVFLMGERLRGFALFSNYDARTQRKVVK